MAQYNDLRREPVPLTADDLIRILHLQPHPEGGHFRETYRAPLDVAGISVADGVSYPIRSASTSIYFLLKRGEISGLHRIRSDEVWHFYAGAPITVTAIHADATIATWRLGQNMFSGERPQCVVPAGAWFGAALAPDSASGSPDFALAGCTVAPGFAFEDFELADRQDLIREFPMHAELIRRLTASVDK